MLDIMIVDDDVPMLKYLQNLNLWNQLNVNISEACYSAVKAQQRFKANPADIVLMDIDMPQIDGLALAYEFKQLKPNVKIIFLTCHENFEFARRAVQLDAVDYLTKHNLSEEILEECLRKTISDIRFSSERLGSLSLQKDLIKKRDLLRQQFLKDLYGGAAPSEAVAFGRHLGIHWDYSHFIMAIGAVDVSSYPETYSFQDTGLVSYGVYNIAEELSSDNKHVTVLLDQNYQCVCLLNYAENLNFPAGERLHHYLRNVIDHTKAFLKVDVSFTVSKPFKLDEFCVVWNSVQLARQTRFYETAASLPIYPDKKKTMIWSAAGWGSVAGEWAAMESAYAKHDPEALRAALDALHTCVRQAPIEPQLLMKRFSQWISGLEMESGLPNEHFHHCLLRCHSSGELFQLIQRFLWKIRGGHFPRAHHDDRIKLIDQYILNHLSEEINFIDVARFLFLNPSYFSRDFKKRVGVNFTDYVHRFKMNIASQRLKANKINIETVAMELGYHERTYFSKLFKKYIGVNPRDFQ